MAKKVAKPPGRGSDQFVLRMPDGMRDKIALAAKARGRSMNAELVDRLEKSMDDSDNLKDLENTVADLWERVERLEDKVFEDVLTANRNRRLR
jgi:hypothetical protein